LTAQCVAWRAVAAAFRGTAGDDGEHCAWYRLMSRFAPIFLTKRVFNCFGAPAFIDAYRVL
jgi:hypothetical protein